MKCLYCGSENSGNVNFCTRCGKKIKGATPIVKTPDLSDTIKKERKRKIIKFSFFQILISIIVSAILVSFLIFPHGVIVRTTHDSIMTKGFSLWHALMILIKGSGRYYPTAFSIMIGFSTLLFVLSVPLFQFFTILSKILKKSQKGIRRIAVIMTSIALGFECLVIPMAYKFIPSFKMIYARETNVLLSEVTGIVSWWSIVMAILVIVLMVISCIITHRKNVTERR